MTVPLTFAFLLSGFVLWLLYEREGVCPMCYGRGKHRSGCPNSRQDETDGD